MSQLAALWYRLTDLTFSLMGHGGFIHFSVMPLFCNYHTFPGRTSTHSSAIIAPIRDAQNEDTMALTWRDKLDPIHQKFLENLVQGLPLYMDWIQPNSRNVWKSWLLCKSSIMEPCWFHCRSVPHSPPLLPLPGSSHLNLFSWITAVASFIFSL